MKNIYLFGIIIFMLLVMTSFTSAATWNSSFESGLNMYFPFESNLTDSINARTFSQSAGTSVFNESGGIYNNGIYIDVNNKINLAYNPQLGFNYTSVNFWVNNLGEAPASYVVMELGSGWAQYSAGPLYWHGICESGSAGNISFTQGKHMLTFVRNESGNYCYIDSVLDVHTTNAFNLSSIGFPYQGSNTGDKEYVDELAVYNRSLSESEIIELYNSGTGIFPSFGDNPPVVTLNSPIDNTNFTISSVTINCSATDDFKIENISLWINGQRNYTLTGTSNFKELYISRSLPVGVYNWTCSADDNSTLTQTGWATNRTFTIYNYLLNSITFNTTTYETKSESYILNISSLDSSKLTSIDMIYNITSYSMTNLGSGIWRYTLTPSLIQNNTIIFQYTYDGVKYNSSTYYQLVNPIIFGLCNSTLNVTYINFTFFDEMTLASLNATIDSSSWSYYLSSSSAAKTFLFTNTTANNNYAFCFSPASETISYSVLLQYASAGYPQRKYVYTGTLTNATTNPALYLLSSSSGIYSSIDVIETTGGPISGADVIVEREFSGIWTIIGESTTGSDGVATFWVNPNYAHRITVSKTGYVTNQVTIYPSQSIYSLALTRSGAAAEYESDIEGLNWYVNPASGSISSGTHNFNATFTSSIDSLVSCRFNLVNSSNISQIFSTNTAAATNTSFCYINFNYVVQNNSRIFGVLAVITDRTNSTYVIVDSDFRWVSLDIEANAWRTITSFFHDITTLNEFGDGNKAEFSRFILFFLAVTIIVGVFNFFFNIEYTSPGATVIIIFIITAIASVAGFLNVDLGNTNVNTSFMSQYGILIILSLMVASYFMTTIRRAHE